MPPSYRLINFTLRPAKAAERKMIAEVCARLNAFSNLPGFRYIGLGSPFFNDFVPMHRRYGMTNLVCIERASSDQEKQRFLFNRPFDCIEMQWGESMEVLPNLPWTGIPTIVWMDYDDPLNESMLADIGTIFAKLEPGSIALFTMQATGKSFQSKNKCALDVLRDKIGAFVPIDATPRDMKGKAFQKLLRRIVDNELKRILNLRNAAVPYQNSVLYKQLFNVLYADGVRMTTIGGVVYRADQEQRLTSCEFRDFEFLREGDVPLEIKVPVLTHREQWKLDSDLPCGNPELAFLAPGDISAYRALYRHYPTFVETDL